MDSNEPNALVPGAHTLRDFMIQVVIPFLKEQDPSCTLNELRPRLTELVNSRFPGAIDWLQQRWTQPLALDPQTIELVQALAPEGLSLAKEWRGDPMPVWGPLLVDPVNEKWQVIGRFPLSLVLPDLHKDLSTW